jgi:hypothetical protein
MSIKKFYFIFFVLFFVRPFDVFSLEREPSREAVIKSKDLSNIKTPIYSETLVDDTHDFITKKVWLLSNTLDAFFSDAEINENKNPGYARFWYEYYNEKGEPIVFRPDFRLRVYLRKTRKLLKFNLSNTSIQQENSSRVDQAQVDGATRNGDKKISANVTKDLSISKFYRFSTSIGARLEWPLNTYVRFKNLISKKYKWFDFKANLDLYYYRESLGGGVYNLNLTRPMLQSSRWRVHNFYNHEHLSTNTYGLSFQILTTWNDNNFTSAQTGVNGFDDNGKHIINEYYVSYTWRRNLYKKWLLFEVTPNIKAKNSLGWKMYPGVYTKVELFFGES